MDAYAFEELSELDIECSLTTAATPGLAPTTDDLEHFARSGSLYPGLLDPDNRIRQRIIIERAIIRRAVTDILANGALSVSVYYGDDEYGCEKQRDLDTIMAAIGACDEEFLHVHWPKGRPCSIFLVYGNDGWDVLADYSLVLEPFLVGANALAEQLSGIDLSRPGDFEPSIRRAENGYVGA